MEQVLVAVELMHTLYMISLSCAVYVASMIIKGISKAVNYIHAEDKKELQ